SQSSVSLICPWLIFLANPGTHGHTAGEPSPGCDVPPSIRGHGNRENAAARQPSAFELRGDGDQARHPYVMFELFNEPRNSPVTSVTTNPKQQTWPDWLSGGREIEPSSAQNWAPYTPVGHQDLVDYLRFTLNVTNVLIADGAS